MVKGFGYVNRHLLELIYLKKLWLKAEREQETESKRANEQK